MKLNFCKTILVLCATLLGCANQEDQTVDDLITAEEYPQALTKTNELLEKGESENNPRILYLKGYLEDKIGNADTAATYYILYLGYKSDESKVWNNLGNIFNEKGEYSEALRCFENAVKLGFDHKTPLVNKAKAEFNLGRYSDANKTLHQLIDTEHRLDISDSLLYAADLYFLDSIERAEKVYSKIHLEEFNPDAFENYFITLLKLGKDEDAKRTLEKALTKYTDNYVVLNMASHFYLDIQPDIEKAIQYCDESIAQNPNYENLAYQNLCVAYKKLEQKTSCCNLLNKLLEQNIKIYPELMKYCYN